MVPCFPTRMILYFPCGGSLKEKLPSGANKTCSRTLVRLLGPKRTTHATFDVSPATLPLKSSLVTSSSEATSGGSFAGEGAEGELPGIFSGFSLTGPGPGGSETMPGGEAWAERGGV